MALRERLRDVRRRVGSLCSSIAPYPIADHPENGGITGDLDPTDARYVEDSSADPPIDGRNAEDSPVDTARDDRGA